MNSSMPFLDLLLHPVVTAAVIAGFVGALLLLITARKRLDRRSRALLQMLCGCCLMYLAFFAWLAIVFGEAPPPAAETARLWRLRM
ncbi:MAG: hypothetical protein IJF59_06025 [Clostridia bacterium]|nr:hypothetical protein [Clostridia bacterium]